MISFLGPFFHVLVSMFIITRKSLTLGHAIEAVIADTKVKTAGPEQLK